MNTYLAKILFNQAGDGGGAGGGAGGSGSGDQGGDKGAGKGSGGDAGGGNGGSPPAGNPDGGTGTPPNGGTPPAPGANGAPDLLFGDSKSGTPPGAGNGTPGNDGKGPNANGGADSGQNGGNSNAGPTIPQNWKDALPLEYREDPTIKLMDDVPSMAKTLINAQKMIGADKVPIPGKHASDTDWKEAYHKLGNPRELADYNIELDKDTEGLIEKDFVDKFKKVAHGLGVLPRQANQLVKFFGELNKNAWADIETQGNAQKLENMKGLEKEWGQTFQERTLAAKAAIKEFTTPEEQRFLRDMGLGNDARFLRIMAKVGGTLSEDKLRSAGAGGAAFAGGMTPTEAQDKIKEINADMKHPYWNPDHDGNKAAKTEMARLNQLAVARK